MKKLMVIIPDRLSEIVDKGELTDRYYNPNNLFDEVHIIMTHNDDIDYTENMQKTVGSAKFYIYSFPFNPSIKKTFFFMKPLVKKEMYDYFELAINVKPDVIRFHGGNINYLIGKYLKEELNIPYIISIHTQPEVALKVKKNSLTNKIKNYLLERYVKDGLKNANLILPVYSSIERYLENLGLKNYKVLYNVINPSNLIKKQKYNYKNVFKIVSVGRHIIGKYPIELLNAVKEIDNIELTFIGNGYLHDKLKKDTEELGILDKKVFFISSMENDQLCRTLHNYDLFAVHSDYAEISKSVLEALLVGMPVIINKCIYQDIDEFKGNHIIQVENSKNGYKNAIQDLISSEQNREELGANAKKIAWDLWEPTKCEKKYSEVYTDIIGE